MDNDKNTEFSLKNFYKYVVISVKDIIFATQTNF